VSPGAALDVAAIFRDCDSATIDSVPGRVGRG
jgi:hypothetical protein